MPAVPGSSARRKPRARFAVLWSLAVLLGLAGGSVHGHGSVVEDGDLCLLELGFYSAHFTIYQPLVSGHREFCEDIPAVSDSIFIMEFEHQSLRQVPVEFRIVRDRQERGRFVRWEQVAAMEDLDAETVYYQAPAVYPYGVLTLRHEFLEAGDYIGVVSAGHPTEALEYHAVFPFHVGPPGLGYWPWIIGILLLVQLNYWRMNGGWRRLRERRAE